MNKIKQYIKKSGYKNEFIAQELGWHKTEISQWIAERRKPTHERLKKLCEILLSSPRIKRCSRSLHYYFILFPGLLENFGCGFPKQNLFSK